MKEKRSQKNLQRNWKLAFAIVVAAFTATAIFSITKADAAYAGNANDIGKFNDTVGGNSINGVKISKNSEVLNYALDMWEKKSNNEWKYTGSNIDGCVDDIESSVNSPVFISGKQEPRFGININSIKSRLPRDGSVVVRKYRNGKLIYERAEYTYQKGDENKIDESISLLKQAATNKTSFTLPSTKYACDSASYVYDMYDAAVIGQSGDVYTDLADCKLVSDGYAYYGAEGEYIVKELPIVEHNKKDGYIYDFEGWYTQPEDGGYEVCIGAAINLNSIIYPRWNVTRISHNVNYIDILGDNPDGTVLGTSTETAYHNDEVSGLDRGSDESAGAYYEGLYYTGCTSATVQEDCDVYRYFRPALYSIVFNGNMSISGETAPLNNCTYGEIYKLTENGFKRNGTVTLDLNAEDATCAAKNINVAYTFKGWAETADGNAVYADCESVSNLCKADGEKQLYAVWDGGNVEVSAIPTRKGYRFDGWSQDKSATSGNTWFDISNSNECTLYAVWVKQQGETDNGVSDNDNNDSNDSNGDNNGNDGTGGSGGNTGNIGDSGSSGDVVTGGSIDSGNSGSGGTGSNTGNDGNTGNTDNTGSENNGSSTDNGNNGSDVNGGNSNNNSTDNGNDSADNGNQNTGTGNDNNTTDTGNNSDTNTGTGSDGSTGTNTGAGSSSGTSTTNKGNKVDKVDSINKGNSTTTPTGNNTNKGSSSTTTTVTSGSSVNSSNTNTDIKNDSIVTQKPNITTDNKKENKDDEDTKNSVVYPKVGKKYKKSGIIYKIVKSNSKNRTVKVIKATKNITKAKIPSTIKIKRYKYKVIAISKKAFIKCSQLKKVIIGKNIKSIGKKAFYKDKVLGSITIKSTKLKSIGKAAFKRIKPKCAVKIAGSKKYSKKVFAMMNA